MWGGPEDVIRCWDRVAGAVDRAQMSEAGRQVGLLSSGKLFGRFRKTSEPGKLAFRKLIWAVRRRAWKGRSGGREAS